MKQYTFKYQNNKGGLYALVAIFGPIIGLPLSALLLQYISWIFWVSIPLAIALIVYGLWKFHKISRSTDTITVDSQGFTSKDYGRVIFSDIHSIPPYGILQAPPPSMRIKLHHGKKLVWYLDSKNPKGQADALIFTAFREHLLQQLKQQNQSLLADTLMDHTQELDPPVMQTEVVAQLESHKKRDVNYKYITIPIGLAFAVLAFARTCGTDLIQEYKDKEFEGIRTAIHSQETDYFANVESALRVAQTYTKKFGPILLFTNDPESQMEFIPDIPKDRYTPEIEVYGLRRMEDNKKLEAYIEHPDSVSYSLAVYNASLGYAATMKESVFSKEDSTVALVYFAVYNPHETLSKASPNQLDTTFRPIEYTSSIQIPKEGKLTDQLLRNMDFSSVRAILQRYEGTYFYMAVKQQDGVAEERFTALEKLIMSNFEEHGIPINQFQRKYFNVE